MNERSFVTIERRDLMVGMRDGVRLATNLFLPGRDGAVAAGRFPAVVARARPTASISEPPRCCIPTSSHTATRW